MCDKKKNYTKVLFSVRLQFVNEGWLIPNFRGRYFVNGFTEKRSNLVLNMKFNILPEKLILDTRKSYLLASDWVIGNRVEWYMGSWKIHRCVFKIQRKISRES